MQKFIESALTGFHDSPRREMWRVLIAQVAGGVLGYAAWGEGRAPALAILLPMMLALCTTRQQAFAMGATYAAALMRLTPAFMGAWYGDSHLAGIVGTLFYVLVCGLVWSLCWSSSSVPWRKALAVAIAWVLALAPPAALWMPGNPLIGWGAVAPGSGWLGVAASLLVPMAFVYVIAAKQYERYLAVATVLGLSLALSIMGYVAEVPTPNRHGNVLAVNTNYPKIAGLDDELSRIQDLGQQASKIGDRGVPITVVWPESVIGTYDTSLYPIFKIELLGKAARMHQTHVVGMDLPLVGSGKFLTAAVAMRPDGTSSTVTARQTVPFALWKPWSSKGFVTDWTSNNMLTLDDGKQAAVIFCYEEGIPILYLINEALDKPDLYLTMTNLWAAQDVPEQAAIQSHHSLYIARLFGRPYVKAENMPRK